MRKAATLSLLLAVAVPSYGHAQSHPMRASVEVAQSTASNPPPKTETKPFGAHSSHAQTAPAPWFDASGLPAPRLMDDLGTHTYRVTASNDEAQRFFNQGLVLAYGFSHLEALRAFKHAQSLDPNCALCFWGEAYVLGPNLNMPMDERATPQAQAAAKKAVEAAARATDKEKALAAALLVRYEGQGERAALDRKYAEAMIRVAQSFPDDPDIATLAAESIMLLSPWDYWADQGRRPKGDTAEAVRLLEGALDKHPHHIAAIHYYIHLVEASDRPQRAEPYADRLRGAVPGAGHLVHMPAHIYYRVGRYKDSLSVNSDAAASDERYVAANPTIAGPYPTMYYPHNVHFHMNSALMAGLGDAALRSADKLSRILSDDVVLAFPVAQPIKQAPYFIHAAFSDPQAILALEKPSDQLPFIQAAWRYARGTAFALLGKAAEAEEEADAIERLTAQDYSALEQAAIPGRGVVSVAEKVVRARAASAKGDAAAARGYAEEAVRMQEQLPYMEPPYWYMPADQTLGAILLKAGDPKAASMAFTKALGKAPNSAWALAGLLRAQNEMGEEAGAAETKRRLDLVKADGARTPDLARM